MSNKWLRISLVAQVVLAIYFQLIQWIPLGKWNYQPGNSSLIQQCLTGKIDISDIGFTLLFALPVLLFYLAYRKRYIWLMWVGLVGYSGWLILEIQTWWVNYIFGASDGWMKTYNRVFSESTKILPSFGRHLAPDGMHLMIQLLLVIVVASLLTGLIAPRLKGSAAS